VSDASSAQPVVLLSLRPKFARLILSGQKRAEIRRSSSRIEPGSIALVYASSPQSCLVGAARVESVFRRAPSTTWRRWGCDTGLSKSEFDDYVDGQAQVTTILLGDVVTFSASVSLGALRARWQPFTAPQSYRYVGTSELDAILNGERHELRPIVGGLCASTDCYDPGSESYP
jgi:predicted transcriptional regulator